MTSRRAAVDLFKHCDVSGPPNAGYRCVCFFSNKRVVGENKWGRAPLHLPMDPRLIVQILNRHQKHCSGCDINKMTHTTCFGMYFVGYSASIKFHKAENEKIGGLKYIFFLI